MVYCLPFDENTFQLRGLKVLGRFGMVWAGGGSVILGLNVMSLGCLHCSLIRVKDHLQQAGFDNFAKISATKRTSAAGQYHFG